MEKEQHKSSERRVKTKEGEGKKEKRLTEYRGCIEMGEVPARD